MTGYHERDNINIEEVLVSFASKTWLSQPLQFYASNMGWTGTNYESYDEGYCDHGCGVERIFSHLVWFEIEAHSNKVNVKKDTGTYVLLLFGNAVLSSNMIPPNRKKL